MILENVSYRVLTHNILTDINCTFHNGAINALIGMNGAGKSTLMGIISGMLKCSEGSVTMYGNNINRMTPKDLAQKRSFVPQSVRMIFDITVEDYILMGISLSFKDKNPIEKRNIVNSALKYCNVFNLKACNIHSLSGGQRQKVEIARAIAQIWQQKGTYLLLDEHTSNLDMKSKYDSMEILLSLVKDFNITVITILHDINLVSLYSNYIVMIKDGKLYKQGKSDDLLKDSYLKDIYNVNFKSLPHANQKYFVVEM